MAFRSYGQAREYGKRHTYAQDNAWCCGIAVGCGIANTALRFADGCMHRNNVGVVARSNGVSSVWQGAYTQSDKEEIR